MEWNITAGRPVYLQLIEQLELAIVTGTYPAGTRMPPVRDLAAGAGVNPNTMQRALQELETRGLLQTQRTAGRSVTADKALLNEVRRERALALVQAFLHQMQTMGYTPDQVDALLHTPKAPQSKGENEYGNPV